MNLATPIGLVTPTLDAPVLQILSRTDRPMTVAQIHTVFGRASYNGVVKALGRLAGQGIVLEDRVGHARQYTMNRHHLGWPAVEQLAGLSDALEARIRSAVLGWTVPAVSVLLFGSAARRDGDTSSDIDILVVSRGDQSEGEAPAGPALVWDEQKLQLATDIRRWTGNPASILEVTDGELSRMVDRAEPIVDELRRDAVVLVGPPVRELLGSHR